ncbi:MAG TPA: hypothetical protein P5538_00460 [Bacteroidales bacterium]|nr:hypothetical protein [Bacteroidales bacterium]HOL97482.1 hypothetical protein [Bacteroidales bacterium]HOM35750.1 hypothetical protein [Bacteroidales bacterium]HPD23032.1 hypothetical protein [Bacteroidales bacterium]HRS98871.1 hypothetical protein [Bacteroidales bacterium]
MKILIHIVFISFVLLSCNRNDKKNFENSKETELATENLVYKKKKNIVYHDSSVNINHLTPPESNQDTVNETNLNSIVLNQNAFVNSYNENILDSMISGFEIDIIAVDTTKSCSQIYQDALNVLEKFFKIVDLIEIKDTANINRLRNFESYTNRITPILERCDTEYNDFMEILDEYDIKYRNKIELILEY